MASTGTGPQRERGHGWSAGVPSDRVLDQLPVGVAVVDVPGGRLQEANARLERIWQRSFSGGDGVDDAEVWSVRRPGGATYAPGTWPLARCVRTGEAVEDEEVEILRGDGTRGTVRVSCSPVLDASGRVASAVLTAIDISEQSRRDGVRRLLAETSRAFSSTLNYEATMRNVARLLVPALADWCSVDIVGEGGAIERLIVERTTPQGTDAPVEEEDVAEPVRSGDPTIARVIEGGRPELVVPAADPPAAEGAPALLRELGLNSAMIVPLIARGRTLGVVVLGAATPRRTYVPEDLDVANELAVRAALAIDNARLYHESQSANRAKADFLAVISHELRTPLTAIIGYTELLGLGVPEPVTGRQAEQVERIEVAARHLLQLIEEILTMTSLETGRTRVRREQVDVADLLRRAAVIIQPMASAKELDLHVDSVEPGLSVESDPDKLLQVMLSLLSNAVKFTDRGEVRISVGSDPDFLDILVSDTGVGVDAGDRDRIFDPFWQAEEPITRRVGGTGLGLAISRRLMELLGGEVRLENTRSGGSTFALRLPRDAGVAARAAANA